MLLSGIIAALTSLLLPIIILLLLLPNACYVVEQQHAVIIERLGKFNRIVNAGFHMKVPVIDRKAATVSLRTMKNGFGIDVKTQDNVTIGLEVSAQYHVSYDMGAGPADSGIYKSYYMLQEPVDQMRDFITDALRSSIPVYTLDEVFAKKDDIAKDVNATVSEQMAAYGFTLVSTLITKIALPTEVENSMNDINAAQRKRAAAQELAEADRIKRVTEATAEAEAMEKAGEGIANQRKAIALGIKDSLEIIQEIVAAYFKLQVEDLHAKKRSRSIAFPRQIAMYLCRELTESSLPAIGQFFGGRDHTTVLHAYDKIKKEKETDEKLNQTISELITRIQKM